MAHPGRSRKSRPGLDARVLNADCIQSTSRPQKGARLRSSPGRAVTAPNELYDESSPAQASRFERRERRASDRLRLPKAAILALRAVRGS